MGIRYCCKDCRKSFTVRVEADDITGLGFFNSTGRPYMKDWRHIKSP